MSWAARISPLVALTNFAAYVIVASILGGDAINGRVEGGRYYLAMQGHSTEVSRAVFEYSRWHTYALWLTFAVAIIIGFVDHRRRTRG
jgi:hypothetical protein